MPRGVRATGYGAAGGRRNTAARSAKQRTRRDRRAADPRVREAMEETRRAQEALEAQMAIEAQNPAIGHAEGALLKKQLEEAQAREAEIKAAGAIEGVATIAAAPPHKKTPAKTAPPTKKAAAKRAPAKKAAAKKTTKKVAARATPKKVFMPATDADFVMIPRFKPFDINSVPEKAEGKDWQLGNARQMVIKGYSIAHVVETTGWGAKWFDDIPVDEEYYGLGEEAFLAAQDEESGKKEMSK